LNLEIRGIFVTELKKKTFFDHIDKLGTYHLEASVYFRHHHHHQLIWRLWSAALCCWICFVI